MNEYLINGQTLTDIADAIRSKTGSASGLSPAQMTSAVTNELVKPAGTKNVTSNGTVDVSTYASANVNVPPTPTQSKTLTLGANAPSAVTPDSGYALSSVPVSLDTSVIKAENIKKDVQMLGIVGTHEGGTTPVLITKTVTANGTYNASSDSADGYSKVTVAIPVYDGEVK